MRKECNYEKEASTNKKIDYLLLLSNEQWRAQSLHSYKNRDIIPKTTFNLMYKVRLCIYCEKYSIKIYQNTYLYTSNLLKYTFHFLLAISINIFRLSVALFVASYISSCIPNDIVILQIRKTDTHPIKAREHLITWPPSYTHAKTISIFIYCKRLIHRPKNYAP